MSRQSKYNKRHGGPYDRGSADAYYRRDRDAHYFKGATGVSDEVMQDQMTTDQIEAYNAGYDDQVASGEFKQRRPRHGTLEKKALEMPLGRAYYNKRETKLGERNEIERSRYYTERLMQ